MDRKGFAPVLIIGVIALVVIAAAVGWYFVAREHAATPVGVACTADAKQCPDGSYVGRTGPDCQFAACPGVVASSTTSATGTSNWKTYTSETYDFSFQYPSDLSLGSGGPTFIILSQQNATSALALEYDLAVVMYENPQKLSMKEYFNGVAVDDLYSGATLATTTVDDFPATLFRGSIHDGQPQETVVIPYRGGFLEIANNNLDDPTFNLILKSFHLMLE